MFIGNIAVQPPVVLAPMAGITSQPFRLLVKEQGCGLLVSEMVSSKGLLHNNQKTFEMLRFADSERPFAVQLFGNHPEEMALAAKRVEELSPDFIDVNMGCPVAKVVRNGEGSALLKQTELACEIVARMADSVKTPITVKLRSGWDEHSVNAPELAVLLEKAGARAITVHARTRDQFYGGAADWRVIKAVAASVKVPVIGNGDVKSASDALEMRAVTGCAAVMVGRAALGNPWLFAGIAAVFAGRAQPRAIGVEERLTMLARHLEMLTEYKGEPSAVRQMRAVAGYYIKGLPGAANFRQSFNQANSRADFYAAVAEYRRNCLRDGAYSL